MPRRKIRLRMPLGPVDYSGPAPDRYRCTQCGVQHVKLWREYNTFLNHQELYCLLCACRDQNKIRTPTEDGRSLYTDKIHHWWRDDDFPAGAWQGYNPEKESLPAGAETRSEREQCDQIGWLVPAVPTEEGDTFWGYTSVPQAGCEWWYRLPGLPLAQLRRLQSLGGLIAARRRGIFRRRRTPA